MGDAGVGHVAYNNGVEGNLNWHSFILAVCGSAGKNKCMRIDVFVGNMLKYVADQSKERALAQLHTYGTHRFLIYPEMSPQQWHSIQLLDIRMLQNAYILPWTSVGSGGAGSTLWPRSKVHRERLLAAPY